MYLYRAVDFQGNTLEFLLSPTRDAQAAKHLFSRALAEPHTSTPRVITVDKNAAYPKAFKELRAERIMHYNFQNIKIIIGDFPSRLLRESPILQSTTLFLWSATLFAQSTTLFLMNKFVWITQQRLELTGNSLFLLPVLFLAASVPAQEAKASAQPAEDSKGFSKMYSIFQRFPP